LNDEPEDTAQGTDASIAMRVNNQNAPPEPMPSGEQEMGTTLELVQALESAQTLEEVKFIVRQSTAKKRRVKEELPEEAMPIMPTEPPSTGLASDMSCYTSTFVALAGNCPIVGFDAVLTMLAKDAKDLQAELDKLRKSTASRRNVEFPSPRDENGDVKNLRDWVQELTAAGVQNGLIYALVNVDRGVLAQNEAYSALAKMLAGMDELYTIEPHYGSGYDALEALLQAWGSSEQTILSRQKDLTDALNFKYEDRKTEMTPLGFMGQLLRIFGRLDPNDFSYKMRYLTFEAAVQSQMFDIILRTERINNSKNDNFDNPAIALTGATKATIDAIWAKRLKRLHKILAAEFHRVASTDAGKLMIGRVRSAKTAGKSSAPVEEDKVDAEQPMNSVREGLMRRKERNPASFAFACEQFLLGECTRGKGCLWMHEKDAPRSRNYKSDERGQKK
jgi:hypothetical protein